MRATSPLGVAPLDYRSVTWVNTARRRAGAPEARTPEPYESSLWIVKRARSPSYAPGSDQPPTPEAPPPATARRRRPGRSSRWALWLREREPTGRRLTPSEPPRPGRRLSPPTSSPQRGWPRLHSVEPPRRALATRLRGRDRLARGPA